MEKKITLKQIAMVGVMAAAVYVASAFLQIPIPTAIDNTRLHMGNVMCLLSGLLLGPVQGGLAAGIGSMFFDLTNPAYITSAPFTFVFKFLMAWICGMFAFHKNSGISSHKQYIIGSALGAFAYVLLYLSKSYIEHRFVLGLPLEVVMITLSQKAVVSSVNAVVSIIVAVPLGIALRPAVRRYLQ